MQNGYTNSNYSSRDFYLSACLLASGIKLTTISCDDPKVLRFEFDCPTKEAESVIQNHWNESLILPTKTLIEAIYQLKNRMRQEMGRN